jgi:hypothetical protein
MKYIGIMLKDDDKCGCNCDDNIEVIYVDNETDLPLITFKLTKFRNQILYPKYLKLAKRLFRLVTKYKPA